MRFELCAPALDSVGKVALKFEKDQILSQILFDLNLRSNHFALLSKHPLLLHPTHILGQWFPNFSDARTT